jgi:glutamyl-Q tRNA(Asp) synthetase
MPSSRTYRGRFAPSPTGPLHFGSLVAALASFLDARANGGQWLVRIEDVDQTRTLAGAADDILRTLDALGFEWDEEIAYQSRRTALYEDALSRLRLFGAAYDCACSRREIARAGRLGPEGPVYPGTCRSGTRGGATPRAVRVHTHDAPVAFTDCVYGSLSQRLQSTVGDFVVRRADGFFAYQLAVVVDDADQGITRVVRGADLLSSTPRQIHLQGLLELPTPDYAHVPVVLGADGRKLSKRDRAHPIDPRHPLHALLAAWAFLGQAVEGEQPASPAEFWALAIERWDIGHVPARLPPTGTTGGGAGSDRIG